jgi:hypothetical protein
MSKLHARIVSVARLSDGQHQRMFEVFADYYANVSCERFLEDLGRKDDVILLLDSRNVIQGFSTMKNLSCVVKGKKVQGLFSGDTVVAKEYWGQRVLGRAFLRYLFTQKLKHPFVPYYWYLISKGYKTYLLMANNFEDHHPRLEAAMSRWDKAVLDAFGTTLYPHEYSPATGLITFPESHGHVRKGVADIDEALLDKYPRIAFFVEKNPTWFHGTELACIARMTWSMPFKYALKARARQKPELKALSTGERERPSLAPTPARSIP